MPKTNRLSTLFFSAAALTATCALGQAQIAHRYSFDDMGTVVMDSVGTAHGVALGGATMTGTGGLLLDGNDDYVELPAGLVSTMTDITIEAWVTIEGGSVPSWVRIFDFNETSAGPGNQGTGLHYLFLSANSSSSVPAAGIKLSTPSSIKVFANGPATAGVETYYAMVYSGSTDELSFYIDGVFQGTETVLDELVDLNDINCWLGQSHTSANANTNAVFNEFRVHAGAFSAGSIAASFVNGPDSLGMGATYCGPAPLNSTGQSGSLLAFGSPVASDNNLALFASNLPTDEFGVFLAGQTQGFIANPSGSQGNLCIVGTIGFYRAAGQVQSTGASGTLSLPLDLTMTPNGPQTTTAVLAGQTWNFQAWHRDSVAGVGLTSNLTDAVSIAFQ